MKTHKQKKGVNMKRSLILITALSSLFSATLFADAHKSACSKHSSKRSVQVGVRPYFLVDNMDEGALKDELQSCKVKNFKKSDFSIAHRGAAMQFPEHTKESYLAAARMGAGIIECDVTFTKDKELVCRHSQCDLQSTTNILLTPLASKCSQDFIPYDETTGTNASAKCCTSDITLDEFKTLKGKMDASNSKATTVQEYVNATPSFRTDLYSSNATLMTHKESIELFKSLNVKMTPELKSPSVQMPFNGFTQKAYAQKMLDEYKLAGVKPSKVFAQSFNYFDLMYWVENEPEFASQAVYLDGRAYGETAEDREAFADFDQNDPHTWGNRGMKTLIEQGVKYIAPPMWVLLTVNENNQIVPSAYARAAKKAGLKIITWTLERSGVLGTGGGWYYQTTTSLINNDGDTYNVLDVLTQDVGIVGIFSDWPATVTFYANCKGL